MQEPAPPPPPGWVLQHPGAVVVSERAGTAGTT